MFCLNCGAQLPEGEQICEKCGTEMPTMPQSSARPDTADHSDETEIIVEAEAETEASEESEAVSENESEGDENTPRLYQEPIPAQPAVQEPVPAPIPAPAPMPNPMPNNMQSPMPYQAPPAQPQYQQPMQGQPPYQPMPAPMPVPPAPPVAIEPFMKRKQYFKSAAPEKIKGKAELLSFFTGMGLGAIIVAMLSMAIFLLDAIYTVNAHSRYKSDSLIVSELGMSADTALIVSIVALSVLALFALFCILGKNTKHFGFYIPLLLPSLALTAISAYGLIEFPNVNTVSFSFSSQNGVAYMMIIALAAVSLLALVLSIVSLALSIIVSNSYKNAQREYIWGATNRNAQ